MKNLKLKILKQPPLIWAIVLFVAVILSFSGYIVSKYVTENKQESLHIAKNFYLESDYLATPVGEVYPKHVLQAGDYNIEFMLKNYPDELRFSEVDIKCELRVSKDGTEIKELEKTFDLKGNQQTNQIITIPVEKPGDYVVTITSVSPYETTLMGGFIVVGVNENISYEVFDSKDSPILQLTVSTDEYEGPVVISWPEGVYPDNTDTLMKAAAGNEAQINVEKDSEYTLLFFKKNPAMDYSGDTSLKAVKGGGSNES